MRPLYRSMSNNDYEVPGVCFVGRLMAGALFGSLFAIVGAAISQLERSFLWMGGMVRAAWLRWM